MRKDIATNKSEKIISVAAFSALMLLFCGSFLYPDTITSFGYYLGQIRISPLLVLFLISAPIISLFVFKKRYRLHFRFVDFFFVSMIVFIVGRGLFSSIGDMNLSGLVLAYGGYSIVMYFGAAIIYQSHEYVLRTLYIFAFLVAIISLLAIPDFLFNWNFPYEALLRDKIIFKSAEYRRVGSTIGAPGQMSVFLVLAIPFIVYLFIHAGSFRKKVMFGFLIVIQTLALWMSFVKSSWLVFIIMVMGGSVFLIIKRPERLAKQMVILGLSVIVVISIFTFIFWEKSELLLFSEQRKLESVDERLHNWEKSPAIFKESPMVGTGIWRGNKGELVPAVDNLYLSIIIEQGIIGFYLVIMTLILMSVKALKILHNDNVYRIWTILLFISLGTVLLTGMTQSLIFVWPTMVVFYLLLGMLRALIEINERNELLCVQQ